MIFLLLSLQASTSDDFPTLTQAVQRLDSARTGLNQTMQTLAGQCTSANDLMKLGTRIYQFDQDKAKEVFELIPDHIDEGGFVNISSLYDPLTRMGFGDIAKKISDINQKGTGK